MAWYYPVAVAGAGVLFWGLKVIKEYERGILFTLGKYQRVMTPGLKFIIPWFKPTKK